MHRNAVTCFWKPELCFQCCLTLEVSPLVCVSCSVIAWVSAVLLSFCLRLRGDGGRWTKIHWNLRAFRSDNTTSDLLLDGNIGKRGPSFNILRAVHLSKWHVACNQCNSQLNSNSKTVQWIRKCSANILIYIYIYIYIYICTHTHTHK